MSQDTKQQRQTLQSSCCIIIMSVDNFGQQILWNRCGNVHDLTYQILGRKCILSISSQRKTDNITAGVRLLGTFPVPINLLRRKRCN